MRSGCGTDAALAAGMSGSARVAAHADAGIWNRDAAANAAAHGRVMRIVELYR